MSVSISEAKISVSEVRVHVRVGKVAKKVGCPRNFVYVFFLGVIYTLKITNNSMRTYGKFVNRYLSVDPNYM